MEKRHPQIGPFPGHPLPFWCSPSPAEGEGPSAACVHHAVPVTKSLSYSADDPNRGAEPSSPALLTTLPGPGSPLRRVLLAALHACPPPSPSPPPPSLPSHVEEQRSLIRCHLPSSQESCLLADRGCEGRQEAAVFTSQCPECPRGQARSGLTAAEVSPGECSQVTPPPRPGR